MQHRLDEFNKKRLEYLKIRIKNQLDTIKDEIGPLRYKLYCAITDDCDNFEELRDMAEMELQIDALSYSKGLMEKLKEYNVGIEDLRDAGCNKDTENTEETDDEEEDIEYEEEGTEECTYEDLIEGLEDEEMLDIMSSILDIRDDTEPEEEKYRTEIMEAFEKTREMIRIENGLKELEDDEELLDFIEDFDTKSDGGEDAEDDSEEDDSEDGIDPDDIFLDSSNDGNNTEEDEDDSEEEINADDIFIDDDDTDDEEEDDIEDDIDPDDIFMDEEETDDIDPDDIFLDDEEDTSEEDDEEEDEDEDEDEDYEDDIDPDDIFLDDEEDTSEEDDEDEDEDYEDDIDPDDIFLDDDEVLSNTFGMEEGISDIDAGDILGNGIKDTNKKEKKSYTVIDDTGIKNKVNTEIKNRTNEVFSTDTKRGQKAQKMFNWIMKAVDTSEEGIKRASKAVKKNIIDVKKKDEEEEYIDF